MCHKQYSSIPSNSKVNPANKIFKHYVELKLQPTYILSALTTQQTPTQSRTDFNQQTYFVRIFWTEYTKNGKDTEFYILLASGYTAG